MTKVHEITQDELTQALQRAQQDDTSDSQGFKTTAELQVETGWGKAKVLNNLHRLKDQGRLEIGYVYQINLVDSLQPIRAYRLISNNGHKE